jgi:hypothetical protein
MEQLELATNAIVKLMPENGLIGLWVFVNNAILTSFTITLIAMIVD